MSLCVLSPLVDITGLNFAVRQTERLCSGQLAIPAECSWFLGQAHRRIAGKQPSGSPDKIRDHEIPTSIHRHRMCLVLMLKEWLLTFQRYWTENINSYQCFILTR
jgi:hypothetical protein